MLTIYGERRRRLLERSKGAQIVATTSGNLFYLTNFYGSGAGIVEPDRTVVVTTPLEKDRAKELGHEVEVKVVRSWAEVSRAVVGLTKRNPVIVDDDQSYRGYSRFRWKSSVFLEARRTKDAEEVRRIKAASKLLDRIFALLERELKPGRTEWEVAAEVMKAATSAGAVPSASDSALSPTIIASGENAALPHSELSTRKLRKGDLVVADIFFRVEGYNSDATRTFAIGGVSGEKKRSYDAVREAQEAAMGLFRAGTACKEVNECALKVLRSHGLEKLMTHSLGHGVGIDIHELPSISRASTETLAEGDVVTDEPGVYVKGRYGIRIEDTILVSSKTTPLTRYTHDLVTV